VCIADEIVLQRASKIASVSQTVSRAGVIECENVQELQSTFDALFFSVCSVCSHIPIEQSLQITRHIMGSSSTSVISALSATPLSAAASKTLNRIIATAIKAF
jgi:hypothetical protein